MIKFFKYFVFLFTSLLVKGQNTSNSNNEKYLFVNTGQIGDLVVSSLILENDNLFSKKECFLLINEKYKDLYKNYSGKISILTFSHNKYRYSIFKKIRLLKFLKSFNFKCVYNINIARGFVSDEISILSNAKKSYAISNNHKYLGKFVGKIFDKKYDEILFTNVNNEYEKILKLINSINNSNFSNILLNNVKTFKVENTITEFREYITISPFTTNKIKDWPVDNYGYIVQELSRYVKIILLGSSSQEHKLKKLKDNKKNVYYKICSLDLVPEIIDSSKLFIGNDSGLTHIAYRLGKPTMILLGGGCFGKYFPYKKTNAWSKEYYVELPCFGCSWECIHSEPYCITKISKEKVLNDALNYLK